MNVAAIVCEYNPMHGGHIYQMEKTRAYLGENTPVICVMSGNYVQRGDFALFDKFTRARCAVMAGADLVIELPLPWSIGSSEQFASGAIHIINSLGVCTHLSFGSESTSSVPLNDIASALLSPDIDAEIKSELSSGISYAAARQRAVEKILGASAEIMRSPNNILGIEYIKTLKKLKSDIQPLAIHREGAEHDSMEGQSSSYIREMIKNGEPIEDYIPEPICDILSSEMRKGRGPVYMDGADMAIMARLRSMTEGEYANLPYGGEGLYMRLMRAAKEYGTVREVLDAVKTKRYTYARIRRMVMCAYLGIRKWDYDMTPPYARVLAMNMVGRRLLAEMKKTAAIPVITKPSKVRDLGDDANYIFDLGARATDLYTLLYENPDARVGDTEYTTSPYAY